MDGFPTVELRTGRHMPVLGLGTWQLSENTAATIDTALLLGYRLIDTASHYDTQFAVGEALVRNGAARDSLYIITKVRAGDDVLPAVKHNLVQLQMLYADLVLLERPEVVEGQFVADQLPPEPVQPPAGADLWAALVQARREGLTRDIGVSSYTPGLVDQLIKKTGEVPAVNQVEWSPFGYSRSMWKHAQANGILIQACSPLTRGERLDDAALHRIGKRHGKTPAQVMLRWSVQLGAVPIPKANQVAHLQENLDIFDFQLTDSEMERLSGLNEHYSSHALSTQ